MITTREAQIIQRILEAYRLTDAHTSPAQKGYRNRSYALHLGDGSIANLILYKSEPGILEKIRSANQVSNYLSAQGFPTRRTLNPRIVRLSSPAKVKYGSLYNYLPGHTIPWEGYTQKHLKLLGLSMASMHTALGEMDRAAGLPDVTLEYSAILCRMAAYFDLPAVQVAMQSKLGIEIDPANFATYEKLLRQSSNLTGQQPLHMDFVRSNILFGNHSETLQIGPIAITGILDFEKTGWGLPVFDVARTLAFLLVDCKYKPDPKIRKYFLYSGYRKRGGSVLAHAELLEPLLNLFLTYDFYKFLRHNPYEFLGQNEHFIRTRELLRTRGLINNVRLTVSEM